jgi:hypothetical protein
MRVIGCSATGTCLERSLAMVDHKSEEVITELAALKKRADELFAVHERTHKELSKVLSKINELNGRPPIPPDAFDRKA